MSNVWTSGLMQMFDVALNEFDETLRACPDHLWEASMWDVSKDQGIGDRCLQYVTNPLRVHVAQASCGSVSRYLSAR